MQFLGRGFVVRLVDGGLRFGEEAGAFSSQSLHDAACDSDGELDFLIQFRVDVGDDWIRGRPFGCPDGDDECGCNEHGRAEFWPVRVAFVADYSHGSSIAKKWRIYTQNWRQWVSLHPQASKRLRNRPSCDLRSGILGTREGHQERACCQR